MREILFRGKRKATGTWIEGYYSVDTFKTLAYIQQSGECVAYSVEPSTVGQYTGLTDKNDKKVFEWDIISAHLDDDFPEDETRFVVVWHECGFYGLSTSEIYGADGESSYFENSLYDSDVLNEDFVKQFEVIGNICDNPELLKGN